MTEEQSKLYQQYILDSYKKDDDMDTLKDILKLKVNPMHEYKVIESSEHSLPGAWAMKDKKKVKFYPNEVKGPHGPVKYKDSHIVFMSSLPKSDKKYMKELIKKYKNLGHPNQKIFNPNAIWHDGSAQHRAKVEYLLEKGILPEFREGNKIYTPSTPPEILDEFGGIR